MELKEWIVAINSQYKRMCRDAAGAATLLFCAKNVVDQWCQTHGPGATYGPEISHIRSALDLI